MAWFSIRATLGSGNAFLLAISPQPIYVLSFRYLEKTASGAKTPLFFLCVVFINNCVKLWLNIAVALDKRRIMY